MFFSEISKTLSPNSYVFFLWNFSQKRPYLPIRMLFFSEFQKPYLPIRTLFFSESQKPYLPIRMLFFSKLRRHYLRIRMFFPRKSRNRLSEFIPFHETLAWTLLIFEDVALVPPDVSRKIIAFEFTRLISDIPITVFVYLSMCFCPENLALYRKMFLMTYTRTACC